MLFADDVAGEDGLEFAAGQGAEGAEAVAEFGEGEAVGAEQGAEEVACGGVGFLEVAEHAAGDQVAVGMEARGSDP
jgi:hypothetical protein